MPDGFSLSEVVKLTGAKRRSIQLWADGGILFAAADTDRLGTGVHRRFSLQEVQIAALLTPLVNIGAPIGVLKRFSGILRQGFYRTEIGSTSAHTEPLPKEFPKALDRACAGVGANYLLFFWTKDSFHMDIKTDEQGPVAIDPAEVVGAGRFNEVLGILDLTALLLPLGK